MQVAVICPKPADAKLPHVVEQLTLVVTSLKGPGMVITTLLPGKLLLEANVRYGVPAQDGPPTPEGLVPASILAVTEALTEVLIPLSASSVPAR